MDKHEIYHSPAANVGFCNRTLCSVLDEMRTCFRTRNFATLEGLIEEAQTYGNRMEAKLHDVGEFARLRERHKQLKAEVDQLRTLTGKEQAAGSALSEILES